MKNLTAVEKLESMFYHRARPTINSNCWVITEQDFRSLILSAKEIQKEQIIDAHIEGQRVFDKHDHTQWTTDQAEKYYNEVYKNK